jgi:predicted O-linked N-acetylglucosamine transferase (SPINDLY family)
MEIGRFDEAISTWRSALARWPGFAKAENNLANALKVNGDVHGAIAAYRRAISLNPNLAEIHYNLGVMLHEIAEFEEAIRAYQQAVALDPKNAEAYANAGASLRQLGRLDEAIAAYSHAIEINPNHAAAYNNLAVALLDKGEIDQAIIAFKRSIALQPNLATTHGNLGNALKDVGRFDQAIAAYRQAMAIAPGFTTAQSNLILSLHYVNTDARAIADELRRWNLAHAKPLSGSIRPHNNDRDPDRRLRIGYVSADFCEHVVGRHLLPLLQHHDRRQFEIFCYSNVYRPDATTEIFQKVADHWRKIVAISDEKAAEQIREDRIDILVDLSLHSANNRLLIFARKPAPVQVTYLAYVGSSGMTAMDYRLSDPYLDPAETDLSVYSETTVRLPRSYWCYPPGSEFPVAPAPAIERGFITFGCLNNFAKVSPAAIDLWSTILAATPRSRLILHAPPGAHRQQITARLERFGVAGDRIEFVPKQSRHDYERMHARIDIALDPFPYGGGITTCDALWMGLPVVTLSGTTAVGRGGRSILSNVGLPELIAFSPEEYVRIAIDLSRDLDRLAALRKGLRERMLASPLMDAHGFARDVEAAYRQMWRKA